jgi:hypothetical protein
MGFAVLRTILAIALFYHNSEAKPSSNILTQGDVKVASRVPSLVLTAILREGKTTFE